MVEPVAHPATEPLLMEKKRKLELQDSDKTQKKLKALTDTPLEDNLDYISLQSALSLLQSRLDQIHREIKELNHFKKCIKETSSIKEVSKLVSGSTDYLKEIKYKGCFVKCPAINWERHYGLDMELLIDGDDITTCYEKINEQYEIIKRDKLF